MSKKEKKRLLSARLGPCLTGASQPVGLDPEFRAFDWHAAPLQIRRPRAAPNRKASKASAGTTPPFFSLENGSEKQLERSWRTWQRQLLRAGVVPAFCGSATKPCGPCQCFAPQSATKRLVTSASSSGRRSEEPRVVVMHEGNTDHKKLNGWGTVT